MARAARMLVLLLLPLHAGWAASAPSLWAVHPLVVLEGSPEDARVLEERFARELQRRALDVAPRACVDRFLAPLRHRSCGAEDTCLARLARACGAARSLFVTVHVAPARLLLSGRIARADLVVERSAAGFAA